MPSNTESGVVDRFAHLIRYVAALYKLSVGQIWAPATGSRSLPQAQRARAGILINYVDLDGTLGLGGQSPSRLELTTTTNYY